jgi:hypothetical protein
MCVISADTTTTLPQAQVGISREISDPVGTDAHEIGYWDVTRFLPPIASANELYHWLAMTLRGRSTTRSLPMTILTPGAEMEVHVHERGNGVYIRFIHRDNPASMPDMPILAKIGYVGGYAMIGMPDAHTTRMLTNEFRALARHSVLCPSRCYRRDGFGTAIHETTVVKKESDVVADDQILCLPPRIQKDTARGTEINP